MPRIALLIDAENIDSSHHVAVLDRARGLGDVTTARIFGDFTGNRLSGWLEAARLNGLQPMMQLSGGRSKNSSDIALAIDAMDILHSTAADAFCLVSNDRDFIPLATRLRAAGKRVYAIVSAQADRRLTQVCSEVFQLEPPTSPEPAIVAAFRAVAVDGEMTLAAAGSALRKHAPDLLPPPGKSKLLKIFEATECFIISGEGAGLKVQLRTR